ncbi:hypothetical protein MMC10_000918 [Thelotrema lepadinum]|nr:hypothetical protein [Thelotrema lepadinum]
MSSLEIVSTVVLDEAHERSLDTDIVLLVLHFALRMYRHLSVVIMSATIESDDFAQYFRFARPEVVHFPGQTNHYVGMSWADRQIPYGNLVDIMFESAVSIIGRYREDILCFVPGEKEIHALYKELDRAKKTNPSVAMYDIHKLFASLSKKQQDRVVDSDKTCKGKPKIIVATNITETTLTLVEMKWVIDSGWHKLQRYDPKSHSVGLRPERISKSSARQRAGRVGRKKTGNVVRLYTPEEYADFDLQVPLEILRRNLNQLALRLLKFAPENSVESLPLITVPPAELIEETYQNLHNMRLIDEKL